MERESDCAFAMACLEVLATTTIPSKNSLENEHFRNCGVLTIIPSCSIYGLLSKKGTTENQGALLK